jgi:hypothetical protein
VAQEAAAMHEQPELAEVNRRLKSLADQLRPATGPCPFMVDQDATKQIALSHYSAGRDATYVHVARKWDGKLPLADLAVTIGYAPFVEGTTIIYDLSDEMMQGKARPFVCDFGQRLLRAYMVLPFQVEATVARAAPSIESPQLHVAFHDARGETIQAALPFELRIIDSAGIVLSEYHATDRNGRFSRGIAYSHGAKCIVRSLLTGREESLKYIFPRG